MFRDSAVSNVELRELAHRALDEMLNHRIFMQDTGHLENSNYDIAISVVQVGEPTPDVVTYTTWTSNLIIDQRTNQWISEEDEMTRKVRVEGPDHKTTTVTASRQSNIHTSSTK